MKTTFSNVGNNRHIPGITELGVGDRKGTDKIEFLLETLIATINDKELTVNQPNIELKPIINVPQIDIPDIVLPEVENKISVEPTPTSINMHPNPWWVYALIAGIPTLAILADIALRLIELRIIGL